MEFQPWLHDLVSCVAAPVVVLGLPTGELRPEGVCGLLISDRRLLSTLRLDFDGHSPTPVGANLIAASTAEFHSVARELGEVGPDPTVLITQSRTATLAGFVEDILIDNRSILPVETEFRVVLGVDFATMHDLKTGHFVSEVAPVEISAEKSVWSTTEAGLSIIPTPVPDRAVGNGQQVHLSWRISLAPGESKSLQLRFTSDWPPLFAPPRQNPLAAEFRVQARDYRLANLVERGVDDLRHLVLTDPLDPDDTFVAAGSPWFFTLFGRDSLWTARMLLPLSTDLAYGTLRTLARRQGVVHNIDTGEAPGKIMHELRPGSPASVGEWFLPSTYYGTIDATPLWVLLLADAWRWGLGPDRVESLLPALQAAIGWILEHSGLASGYLRYIDESGKGLANQGWKDSGNSIQHLNGKLAEPPIALCEVQAYAYRALLDGADLLEAFNRSADLAARSRRAAADLQARFRRDFWVHDRGREYPAIALDGALAQVKTASSNLGHLLGTGLLDEAEVDKVAQTLAGADLTTEFGLRTMSATHRHFNPVGYQIGSIWPHDTAIAIAGLSAEGVGSLAFKLAEGLLNSGAAFDYRLPELMHGSVPGRKSGALPYPASCRPQAWSAAASVTMAMAALDLKVDVPGRRVEIAAVPEFAAWWPLDIRGLRIANQPVDVHVDIEGQLRVDSKLDFISVRTSGIGAGRT